MKKGLVLEIEDFNGNTIGFFKIESNNEITISDLNNLEIADKESDYLLNTDYELIRLQVNKEL